MGREIETPGFKRAIKVMMGNIRPRDAAMPHSSGRREPTVGISTFSTWLKFNCSSARTWPLTPLMLLCLSECVCIGHNLTFFLIPRGKEPRLIYLFGWWFVKCLSSILEGKFCEGGDCESQLLGRAWHRVGTQDMFDEWLSDNPLLYNMLYYEGLHWS